MVSHGRVELLAHPLSQKYLQMKWNSYGKYFHVTNLLFYTVFLMFVTLYASQLMRSVERDNSNLIALYGGQNGSIEVSCNWYSFLHKVYVSTYVFDSQDSQIVINTSHHSPNGTNNSGVTQIIHERQIRRTSMMLISSIAIIVYIVLNAFREVLQIYHHKWKYLFEPNNLVSWMLYISAMIMVSPVFNGGCISDVHFSATSMTVFLSWFNLLLFLQRFDQVSAYNFPEVIKSRQLRAVK